MSDILGGETSSPAEGTPAATQQTPGTPAAGAAEIKYPESFPTEFHGDPSITKFFDKEANDFNYGNMMTSLLHAQKMVGGDKILVPSKDATPEDWGVIYDKLGRPTRENYKLGIEGVDENADPVTKGFLDVAHEAGILPHQAKQVVEFFNQTNAEQDKQFQLEQDTGYQEGLDNLKKSWGSKFEDNVNQANTAVKNLLPEDMQATIKEAGYFADPLFVKMMHEIAPKLMDDNTLSSESFKGSGYSNNDSIKDEYQKIMKNPLFKTNPTLQNRQLELIQLALKKGMTAADLAS